MKTCSTCERRGDCIDYKLSSSVGLTSVCEFYKEEPSSILFTIVAYFKGESEPVVFENITKFTISKEMDAYILSESSGCEVLINAHEISYIRKVIGDIFYDGDKGNTQ